MVCLMCMQKLEVITYRGESEFSNDTDVMPFESVVFLTEKKTKNMFWKLDCVLQCWRSIWYEDCRMVFAKIKTK
jgi:hypothetical protein